MTEQQRSFTLEYGTAPNKIRLEISRHEDGEPHYHLRFKKGGDPWYEIDDVPTDVMERWLDGGKRLNA